MICVNFWGGAGIGKSTIAGMTYAQLKMNGMSAELVGEYAKELCYEDSMRVIKDQLYLFAEQEHRLRCLRESGIEIAVCDSPTPLSILYDVDQDEELAKFIWTRFAKYDNLNFLLKRNDSMFSEQGRIDTLETAKAMDGRVKALLDDNGIEYIEVHPDEYQKIVSCIQKKIG